MTIKLHGIELPFTSTRGGPSMFPNTEGGGFPGKPGYHAYTCDWCGLEVHQEPMGGVNVDWSGVARDRDYALEFHWRHCPKAPAQLPGDAQWR